MADPQFEPTRKRKLVGHLIGIPLADQSIRVCVVLWQSLYWKNVISLGISRLEVNDGQFPPTIDTLISAMDTSAAVIRAGYWQLGPKIEMTVPDGFSTRRSADSIWCDDEEIRESTREDRHLIPDVTCAGMGMVEQYIPFLDQGDDEAKLFIRHQKIMEAHLQRYPVTFG